MRNLRKILTAVFAAGAILAAPAAANASVITQAPAAAVVQRAAAVSASCTLSVPSFTKQNGNHDFQWTTRDTCKRTVRTQLQRTSYRGWVGYDNWRVWSHHTLTHNWKEVCDYGHGDYNYRVAVEALQSSGSWGPPIYSPEKGAHCGPSA
jgi:hypothetical protein